MKDQQTTAINRKRRWRAPSHILGAVRAEGMVPIQGRNWKRDGASTNAVDRQVAEAAYAEYARQYGTSQSFERLHDRGGFGVEEMIGLLAEACYRLDPSLGNGSTGEAS